MAAGAGGCKVGDTSLARCPVASGSCCGIPGVQGNRKEGAIAEEGSLGMRKGGRKGRRKVEGIRGSL